MKLYLIGGLGADERVFKYLRLQTESHVIQWVTPKANEEISEYAQRLLDQIDHKEEFGLLGVSFGGIVAVEMAKLLPPKILILISSVARSNQLPQSYIALGRTGILNILPTGLIKPPRFLLGFLFGVEDKRLLEQIIKDTKLSFIKWALSARVSWTSNTSSIEPIRIHGTEDKLIPLKGYAIEVEGGGHFMIVDKAREVNSLVNQQLACSR